MRWAGLLLLLSAVAGVVALGDIRTHPHPAAALFVLALLGSIALVAHHGIAAAAPRGLLGGLLVVRLIAMAGSPSLSDDIARYVHEGRAQRLGLAVPYETPPAQITPPPDDGTSERVNHKDVPAAYPPGSELVLLFTVAVGDAVGHPQAMLRLALGAADVGVLIALFRRRSHLPRAWLWYGAHPLPILEIVLGAHLDALGMAALTAAVLGGGAFARGALIGAAAHAKPVALIGLLSSTRRQLARTLAGAVVAIVLLSLPHLAAGAPLSRGFLEYATRWRAAPFLYAVIEAPLRPVFAARADRGVYAHLHVSQGPFGVLVEEHGVPIVAWGAARSARRPILLDETFFARLIAGALIAAGVIVIARRVRDPALRVGTALALFWLLAPTVHPWYFLWLVPFAALSSSRALWAMSAAAPLLYQPVFGYAASGAWQEATWPRWGVLAALVLGVVLDRRRPPTSRAPSMRAPSM